MIPARFAGSCACCGRRYEAGAELVRGPKGWTLATCTAPSEAAPASYRELVLDTLARARAVAARASTTKSIGGR